MPSQKPAGKKKFVPPTPEELCPLFPAYEIQHFIAAGGMGAVYKARQISLDRPVAIKILPKEFGSDKQFRENFEAEAKAMAKLNHPNLMAVYDFGNVEGMLFIAMEFIKGKALYYSAHRKQIDPETAFKLILRITKGLNHAHENGILHRDIKPANILLLPDATPKIGDFGLARAVDSRSHKERTTFGTPGYTAPEVYSKKYPVDERSDIFSVGAMLCELLTGELPKPNSSYMITGIDPRFDAITRKATHPVPEQRYRDTNEFIQDIKELLPKLSQKGRRLKTGLSPSGHITTRVTTGGVAPHVTGPVVTGPLTAPVTAQITQRQTLMAGGPHKSSAIPVLITLVCLAAVGAVIYFVIEGKRAEAPIVPPAAEAPTNTSKPGNSPTNKPIVPQLPTPRKAQIVSEDGSISGDIFEQTQKNIENSIRSKHRREYSRIERKKKANVLGFVDRSTKFLNNPANNVTNDERRRVVGLLKRYQANLRLPDRVPPYAPEPLHADFRASRDQHEELTKQHSGVIKKARKEYLDALARNSQKFSSQNLSAVAKDLENLIKADDGYLHHVLKEKSQ